MVEGIPRIAEESKLISIIFIYINNLMNKIELSIIIVTFKSRKVIGDCLESIERFNDLDEKLEVIVVDNSPDDETYNYISKHFYWVKIIKNKENRGFGHGNNIGVKMSSGKYILFLNPDTILIQPILKYAVNQFEKDPKLGTFSMILTSNNGKTLTSYSILPERRNIFPAFFIFPIIKYLKLTPKCVCPMGADLFIRRKLFLKAGGFDEKIFLFYEEPDLIRRINNIKVKIFNKHIIHLEGCSFQDNKEKILAYIKSERYYFAKYGLDYYRYIRILIIYLNLKLFFYRLFRKNGNFNDLFLLNHYKKIAKRKLRY